MPVPKDSLASEVVRSVKAYSNVEAGITRGEAPKKPEPKTPRAPKRPKRSKKPRESHSPAPSRRAGSPENRAEDHERMEQQARTIERQKRQLDQNEERLSEKDRQVGRLKEDLVRSDSVAYDGAVLPPKRLRPGRASFQDDEIYLASARQDARMLAERLGLAPDSRLLDVGCGPGRLAIGILQEVGEIQNYLGVDVNEDAVMWGRRHMTPRYPGFRFLHIDVENSRYNPSGSETDSDLTFPFADEEFDIITLYSVFTHMLAEGVRGYLKEFRRILRPDGTIYLTAFLEDGVPDVEENPRGYLGQEWKGPLHCVRYDKEFFEKLLDETEFRLVGSRPLGSPGSGKERGLHGWFVRAKS